MLSNEPNTCGFIRNVYIHRLHINELSNSMNDDKHHEMHTFKEVANFNNQTTQVNHSSHLVSEDLHLTVGSVNRLS